MALAWMGTKPWPKRKHYEGKLNSFSERFRYYSGARQKQTAIFMQGEIFKQMPT